ncbi:TetR/AcrR family transcriptional regulator [Nocardiopsis trehalosi]|jgi:AcrR family transcriptional regulator|uniref:TetR/AcrR family transcriptional regulator n=1 Tax=Nocardiopsis trehalosi TaxID=109329 RepID=UPI0008368E18|nr:TetR/AcrR family transcriptional regulator [Nocardiopsis trehalosi]
MPRPRSLDDTRIAAAALAVLDRGGPAALTMRALATELGMGTMSLYRYVSDREGVEDLVLAHVLAGVDPEPPPGVAWRERVVVLAVRVRAALAAHPAVLPLLATRRHASPGALAWGESVLAALTEGGFAGAHRVTAFRAVTGHLYGAVLADHFGPLSGPGTDALAALPDAEYPLLIATARAASGVDPDAAFRASLAAVLDGLSR